jgi:hypothetical protein
MSIPHFSLIRAYKKPLSLERPFLPRFTSAPFISAQFTDSPPFTLSGDTLSWSAVDNFYLYMTNYDQYLTGPYGSIVWNICNQTLDRGDVLQISNNNGASYFHEGMIGAIASYPTRCYDLAHTYINAHDADRNSYPLANWSSYSWRFIHIAGWYN